MLWIGNFYLHDPTAERIQLPFATRTSVWDLYESDWKEHVEGNGDREWEAESLPFLGNKGVKRQTFLNMWEGDRRLKHIVIRKQLRFSLCGTCVSFIESRAHSLGREELAELKAKEHRHSQFVRGERGSYYVRRALGRIHPESYLSIILDGADQAAFGSPHFCTHSKDTEKCWRIATSLMGAIVHGVGVFGFSYMPNIKHGSNLTIEVLHRVLSTVWEKGTLSYLPDVLYLQLDGTSKQNRNKYLLGFLGLLVEWQLFESVVLSILPVGHTHEDIDQLFSRVATYLRKHDARSRAEFLQAFEDSFNPRKYPTETAKYTDNIEQAANFSDYFDITNMLSSMEAQEGKRSGISQFHQFKILKEDGKIVLYVREWCATSLDSDPWRGLQIDGFGRAEATREGNRTRYHPHVLFRDDADLSAEVILSGFPASQRKDFSKYTKTGKDGQKYNKYFRKTRDGVNTYIRTRHIPAEHADDLRYSGTAWI